MERPSLVPEVDPLLERIALAKRISEADGEERRLLAKLDALNAELDFTKRVSTELHERWRKTQEEILAVMRQLSQCIRERARREINRGSSGRT